MPPNQTRLELIRGNIIETEIAAIVITATFSLRVDEKILEVVSGKEAQQNNKMVPERIQFVLSDEETYNCYIKQLSNLGFGLSCLIE